MMGHLCQQSTELQYAHVHTARDEHVDGIKRTSYSAILSTVCIEQLLYEFVTCHNLYILSKV